MIRKIINRIINRETITYIIFGVLTTVVNWIVYRICDEIFGKGETGIQAADGHSIQGAIDTIIQKGAAGIVAWVAAVLFAYVTNRYFVFEKRAHGGKDVLTECGKFFGARVLTGIIEVLGVPLMIIAGLSATLFGMDVAKLIISVIIVILNYIFSKLFVFKAKE